MKINTTKKDWYSEDVKDDTRWIRKISLDEKLIIEGFMGRLNPNESLKKVNLKTSYLSKFAPLYNQIFDAVINQWGFIIIKGMPSQNTGYSVEAIRKFYFEFCQHLGIPLIQNKNQDLLFDIKEIREATSDPNARGPQLNNALPLHADHGGLLGMYCIQSAEIGGHTLLGSAKTIHDEIGKIRPDLLNVLYQSFYGDRRGHEPESALPYDFNPVFAMKDDELICQYVGLYYHEAPKKFPYIPELTKQQIEALTLFEAVSNRDDIKFEIKLEPGDSIFINNNKVFHGRAAFQNSNLSEIKKRHLLRIWLATPKIKSFPHYYGYPMPYRDA